MKLFGGNKHKPVIITSEQIQQQMAEFKANGGKVYHAVQGETGVKPTNFRPRNYQIKKQRDEQQ